MTIVPMVPQEIIAQLRARLSRDGLDARPVFVIGPNREDGQIEFFTGAGDVWPVVLRVAPDGALVAMPEGGDAAANLTMDQAMEHLCAFLAGASPRAVAASEGVA